MGKELQFPTKTVRDWAVIEGTLRQLLLEASVSEALVAHVMPRMKGHFAKLNRGFDLNVNLPFKTSLPATEREAIVAAVQEGFSRMAPQIHDFTNMVLFEMLLDLEVRLYVAQHRSG